MKKLLLLLACAVFYPEHGFSGLKEIAQRYVPNCDATLGEEELRKNISDALSVLDDNYLGGPLVMCVEENEMGLVTQELVAKLGDDNLSYFLNACLKQNKPELVKDELVAKLKDNDLSEVLSSCVTYDLPQLVKLHIGRLEGGYLSSLLQTCLELDKTELVKQHIGRLEGKALSEVLNSCLECGLTERVKPYIENLDVAQQEKLIMLCIEKKEEVKFLKEYLGRYPVPAVLNDITTGGRLLRFIKQKKLFTAEELEAVFNEIKQNTLIQLRKQNIEIENIKTKNAGNKQAVHGKDLEDAVGPMRWWAIEAELTHSNEELEGQLNLYYDALVQRIDTLPINATRKATILNGMGYVARHLPLAEHFALIAIAEEESHRQWIADELTKVINNQAKGAVIKEMIAAKTIFIAPESLSAILNLKHYKLDNVAQYSKEEVANGIKDLAEDLRKQDLRPEAIKNVHALKTIYSPLHSKEVLSGRFFNENTILSHNLFSPLMLLAHFYEDAVTQQVEGQSSMEPAKFPYARCLRGLQVSALLALAEINDAANYTKNFIPCTELEKNSK